MTGICAGVRVKQELIRIEPVTMFWLVRSVNPITVARAGFDARNIAVPDLVGIFRQFDTIEFFLTLVVKNTNFDLCRVL